jgi:hypothetical protein
LALKNGSSTGVDAVDVKYVLSAFQALNKVALRVSLHLEGTAAHPDLMLTITAWDTLLDVPEAKLLASQKLLVGFGGARTMEAAILQGLYGLDAQLGAEELAKVHRK